MAQNPQKTGWEPADTVYRSPTQYSASQETSNPPTNSETPYKGHSAHSSPNYFGIYPHNPPTEPGYPSPPNIWDPLQQNPPFYNQRSESFLGLLNSRTPRDQTPDRPSAPRKPPRGFWSKTIELYKKHWTPAWSMCFFLMAGIAFAIGHHVYYRHLDGTQPDQQLRKLRYGTALAFFAKTCLITSVILAYRQRVWMVVRRKMLTLGVVDSLFAAAEDLTALIHWEAFKRAKVAMFLALYIWSTPLVVILTSETLSVQPKMMRKNDTCSEVYTLNFDHEVTNYWRNETRADNGFFQLSVSFWNATTLWDKEDRNLTDPSEFDYWTSPSPQWEQVAMKSVYLGDAVWRDGISDTVCGKGWNCSVVIDFVGPGYKCEEVASGANETARAIRGSEAPFNTSILVPDGEWIYYSKTDAGDYGMQLNETEIGGVPKTKPPYPKNLGAFRTEPLVWIAYAVPTTNRSDTNLTKDKFIPKIIGCEHYMTNYSVNLTYLNGIQYSTVTKRDNISLVLDTRFLPDRNSAGNRGLVDNTTATPESRYVFPTDLEKYRTTAAYHAVGKQLRDALNGTIALVDRKANTKAIVTRLIETRNYLTVDNFATEVEKFYEDIVLSLLSTPQFAAVSWAKHPETMAGQNATYGRKNYRYDCIKTQTSNRYKYHERDLWLVYSIAIFLALIAVILGINGMRHERTYRDTRFSSIVAVTRGQSLNTVMWEDDEGKKKLKVGFGRVQDVSGETKQGFGLEGDVSQDRPQETTTLRSPVIQMRDWRDRRTSRYMDSPEQH